MRSEAANCRVDNAGRVSPALSWLRGLLCLALVAPFAAMALDFDHQVPLVTSPGGSFYVTSSVSGIEAEFLVDTGAGYVTVDSALFKALR
ncbi:MAG: hypothetical protein RIC38_17405, partial [Chromatocurvus sp.]